MVKNLENAGMPSNKIMLGVPFYGRLGATITKPFDQLRKDYINKNGFKFNFDKQAKVPYLTKNGIYEMSYDNELSILIKGDYVLKNNLGGIFSWTSTYDQANILARAMYLSINDPKTLKDEVNNMYGDINI